MHEPFKPPVSLAQYLESMSQAGFQAGISWQVVETKWPGIKEAFKNFDPEKAAGFSGEDIDRMMQDPKVIRNRAKLEGVILNARRLLELDKEYRGFKKYLSSLGGFDNQLKALHREFKFLGESGAYYFLWQVGENVPDWETWETRHTSAVAAR